MRGIVERWITQYKVGLILIYPFVNIFKSAMDESITIPTSVLIYINSNNDRLLPWLCNDSDGIGHFPSLN